MSDRELLELAAKAAGIVSNGWHPAGGVQYRDEGGQSSVFDPLNRDGDAFRLAVKLSMSVEVSEYEASTYAYAGPAVRVYAMELWREDKDAATRRAIVRAAAEIGRGLASDPSKRG